MGNRTRTHHSAASPRRGFTLIELLVVLVIILLISVVALPAVLPALAHRQVSEAGRILQGTLVGARDQAIHDGQPSGIRLIPDPTFITYQPAKLPNGQPNPQAGWVDLTQPLAYARIVPIGPAPEYTEGKATVRAGFGYARAIHNPAGANVAVPSLVLEESPLDAHGAPNSPTSWSWNIRVGDQLQLNGAGPWYTVVGPMWTPNPEGFTNCGPAGTTPPLRPPGSQPVEWLVLVNGRDDDNDGFADAGWDGVDEDADGVIDNANEWEPEQWIGAAAKGLASVPYAIRRRPLPMANAREVALPSHVVIDATTGTTTQERSRLPINPMTGAVEIMINSDGTAYIPLPYGVRSAVGLGHPYLIDPTTGKPLPYTGIPAWLGYPDPFYHFWLADRSDVSASSGTGVLPTLPAPKEDCVLVTLDAKSGRIIATDNPDPANPFAAAQQGAR